MRKGPRKTKSKPIRKKAPNWAEIKAEYEGNRESVRAIAHWHGVVEGTIRHRAKTEGWKRGARPDTRTPASPSPEPSDDPREPFVPVTLAEAATVEPQELVERGRGVVARLLDELDATTAHLGEIDRAIMEETAQDKSGGLRYAMQKAVSLPSRSMVIKNLASAAKTLTESELAPGKKAVAQDAAKRAGAAGNKFATASAPPRLVVNNGQ